MPIRVPGCLGPCLRVGLGAWVRGCVVRRVKGRTRGRDGELERERHRERGRGQTHAHSDSPHTPPQPHPRSPPPHNSSARTTTKLSVRLSTLCVCVSVSSAQTPRGHAPRAAASRVPGRLLRMSRVSGVTAAGAPSASKFSDSVRSFCRLSREATATFRSLRECERGCCWLREARERPWCVSASAEPAFVAPPTSVPFLLCSTRTRTHAPRPTRRQVSWYPGTREGRGRAP